jgi:hypothetical protein
MFQRGQRTLRPADFTFRLNCSRRIAKAAPDMAALKTDENMPFTEPRPLTLHRGKNFINERSLHNAG